MATIREPIYLAGPTGSGKTAVALALASRIGPVEIVNADAYQIYRGMEILTATPTPEEMAALPHHLFGFLDPSEKCDAAHFADLARAAIGDVADRATPIVVGGSGLYLKAVTHGLADLPKADPDLRAELDGLSLDEIVARYESADPAGAAATNLKNRRYVTRNLEITLLARRPASEIKNEWAENQPDIRAIYLHREREDLYARIDRRTERMFAYGVIEEVDRIGPISETAEKAIGLREIRALLAGKIQRDTCIAEIQRQTRRYAKRQETWFRRETAFHRLPVAVEESASAVADRIGKLFAT